jgi:hypothetical protein
MKTSNIIEGKNFLTTIDFKTLKKFRNASHSLLTLGVLWVILVAFPLIAFGVILAVGFFQKGDATLSSIYFFIVGLLLLVGILGIFASYGVIARPEWGRSVGKWFCLFAWFGGNPIGFLLGIWGLTALSQLSKTNFFGSNRILHKDLENEYRYRKQNKLY